MNKVYQLRVYGRKTFRNELGEIVYDNCLVEDIYTTEELAKKEAAALKKKGYYHKVEVVEIELQDKPFYSL